MAAGVAELKKVKLPDWPGIKAVPEPFTHLMEFPETTSPQPSEFAGLAGTAGKLLPLVVQPYQKLLRAVEPVSCSRMV